MISMPRGAINLGRALAPLRESGVLIVGSGSLTHNLFEFAAHTSTSAQYAEEFARWVREAVIRKETERLLSYRIQAPHAERAHPTEEHFQPLLVALGAASDADDVIATWRHDLRNAVYGYLRVGRGDGRETRLTRVRHGTDSTDLSDDTVAAICHPLQFVSPEVLP